MLCFDGTHRVDPLLTNPGARLTRGPSRRTHIARCRSRDQANDSRRGPRPSEATVAAFADPHMGGHQDLPGDGQQALPADGQYITEGDRLRQFAPVG
jgi:hypothetical protein